MLGAPPKGPSVAKGSIHFLGIWPKSYTLGVLFSVTLDFEQRVQTLGALAVFRLRGSDFGRSGSHFEQGVQTLGAPACISSAGF